MEFTSQISLVKFTDVSPPEFVLEVKSTYDVTTGSYQNNGVDTFSATQNGDGNYEVKLNISSSSTTECPIEHGPMNLGQLSSSGEECGVDVDLMLGGNRVGGGHIRLSGAELGQRPIKLQL